MACRSESGFTLLELMVVFAVVGLILSFAPINWTAMIGGRALNDEIENVGRLLEDTRMSAILSGSEKRFVLDTVSGDCRVKVGDEEDGSNQRCFSERSEISLVSARQEQVGDASSAIRFFPDGSSTGGRILAQRDGKRGEVKVDWLTGSVTVNEQD